MNFNISHPQDLIDTFNRLKDVERPFMLQVIRSKPTEETELKTWKRINSFFHRGIVPTYCDLSGLLEDEAKRDLQQRFATVEEHVDHYLVESIGGMSLQRLTSFVEQCQTFLIINYGERANDLINYHRKTKIVQK